jgi:AraC-like DNA-binding protein
MKRRRLTLTTAAQSSNSILFISVRFAQPLDIATIAARAHMSPSTLHHHFKSVTSVSPLQYLKLTRLHRARLLMLKDGLGAAEAAHRVGYASPSQFSREFKRLFGSSPTRELRRLRGSGVDAAQISSTSWPDRTAGYQVLADRGRASLQPNGRR